MRRHEVPLAVCVCHQGRASLILWHMLAFIVGGKTICLLTENTVNQIDVAGRTTIAKPTIHLVRWCGLGVRLGLGVDVGVAVAVAVGEGVGLTVEVGVGAGVPVGKGVGLTPGVGVGAGVVVGEGVGLAVGVGVGVD